MRFDFEIQGELMTLNEYSTAERANRYRASKAKAAQEEFIMWQIPGDAPHFNDHVYIYFSWIRSNARYDKDNVAFAKKFILDALQKKGVIRRDGWRDVTPYDRAFHVNKSNPRTIVTISTEEIAWN